MSKNFCPECGTQLNAESINLSEGVALCPSCGQLSRLSDVVSGKRPAAEILSQRPRGCLVTEAGQTIVVHATLRSIVGFIGALFVSLFWNGIVSVFVLIALSGLYANLVGPLPAWFPAPQDDAPMTLGMTLFLCLFLVPFVTVGSVMIGAVFLNAFGRVEVRINEGDACVNTGIGWLVWRRRFDPNQVRSVGEGLTSWETNDRRSPLIVIEADRTIKFGSLLENSRREWLRAMLHELLTKAQAGQRREVLSQVW